MSFNSREFNTAIKCASVKRFHYYVVVVDVAVCAGGEKKC